MEVIPSKLPLQESPLPFLNITHLGKCAALSSTHCWISLKLERWHSISGWEFRLWNLTYMNFNPSSVPYKLIWPYIFKLLAGIAFYRAILLPESYPKKIIKSQYLTINVQGYLLKHCFLQVHK